MHIYILIFIGKVVKTPEVLRVYIGFFWDQPLVFKDNTYIHIYIYIIFTCTYMLIFIGKVVKTPEVLRVYIGSFWDQPLVFEDNAQLFEMEEKVLIFCIYI
jgi:hypothetical protein